VVIAAVTSVESAWPATRIAGGIGVARRRLSAPASRAVAIVTTSPP